MPFYRVHSGFGGDCGVHHRGRRHHFGPPFHHGPPPHHHHHQHHHRGPPPFHPPPHGPPPFLMAGGPPSPRFGRRGHRFMMKHNLHETKPDAEANSVDPAVDGSPFPPHHGPPPMGEAPTFGRRGRRGRRFQKAEAEASNDAASDTIPPTVPFSKPHRRPHCRRGGPRGMCSDLPRESPVEVTRESNETKTTETPETPSGPHGVQCSFRHYPPHPHRHPHVSKKMMLLSLLEEQKRAIGELEQSKNQTDADSAPTSSTSIIQVPQQWHVEETDQSLVLSIDVTGFKLEDLQLKVEDGLLSLQGQRTNSLGDVFVLSRTKTIDSSLYDEAGIEARHDTEDESCSILRITIPRKTNNGSIPIQFVECIHTELSNESSTTTSTTSTVVEDHEKEVDTADFIPKAEFVSEQDNEEEEEEQLGQVETVQEEDSTVASLVAVQENDSHDSDTTQSSWEDDDLIVVDGPAE